MAIPSSQKFISWRAYTLFWCGAFAALFGVLWMFSDILLPFVVGIAVAYLLDPVVLRLTRRGLSRTSATVLILLLFLALLAMALSVLVPLLIRELSMLAEAIPELALKLRVFIEAQRDHLRPYIGDLEVENLMSTLTDDAVQTLGMGRGVLTGILSGGHAAFSFVAFAALMPIVAFYMMVEWPRIVTGLDDLFPRKSAATIRGLLAELDGKISGFVRGQVIICLMLALYYAMALTYAGIDYGALIGAIGGVLSIIPFVGSLTALGGTIIMGLLQVPVDGWGVLITGLAVIGVGHFIEAHFITPKIVGDSVGLHPLWVIFALLAGASLNGLLGMFVAVPVAAAVAVLVTFGVRQYMASHYYLEGQTPKG